MHWTIGKKLGVSFGIVVMLVALSSSVAYIKISSISQTQFRIINTREPLIAASYEIVSGVNMTASALGQEVLSASTGDNSQGLEQQRLQAWSAIDQSASRLKAVSQKFKSAKNKMLVNNAVDNLTQLKSKQEQIVAEIEHGGRKNVRAAASEETQTAAPLARLITNDLQELLASVSQMSQKENQMAVDEADSAKLMVLLASIVVMLLGSILAFVISRKMVNALRSLVQAAQKIAAGDLTSSDAEVELHDEVGELARAIVQMQSKLRSLIGSVASSTQRLASASTEISSSASQTAASSREQASQTHQVASAMHEVSTTTEEVSENSRKAANAADEAVKTARRGGKVVESTLETIRRIASSSKETASRIDALGKSSQRIGTIVAVIDDIADQTNLLALNAAIEAARAGEQGRGFAVVADEVRKLAERTATATKEIGEMIGSIQAETRNTVAALELGTKDVETGVEKTSAAGEALSQIISVIDDVGQRITQIATAATEQTSAVESINGNVNQIASFNEQSSSAAIQTAKACEDLSSLALELQQLISNFTLEEGSSGRNSSPAAVGAISGAWVANNPERESNVSMSIH